MSEYEYSPTARRAAWGGGSVPWVLWGVLIAAFSGFAFYDGLAEVVKYWTSYEEYSHGFLIPLVSLYLAWQRKAELAALPLVGSAWGLLIVLLGVGLLFVGELSTLYIIVVSSLIVVLTGLVVTLWGSAGLKLLWVPLVYLVFMIPIPPFLQNKLSGVLQLLSSELGVMVIRLFGISVFLEGNVIDLGVYQLQVVEACNGLRYLYPLASFGFLLAYMFQAPLWQRAVIFLSTIPITVLMNSFRIGVIGVLVEYFGIEQAEGFLHDFEGWVVFMACVAILLAQMWLLARLTGDRRPWREVFKLGVPQVEPGATRAVTAAMPAASIAACVLLGLASVGVYALGQRVELVPQRQDLTLFPDRLKDWQGRRQNMEQHYLDALKLNDYLLADFQHGANRLVNLYVAWYDSQRKGKSIHSPRSCIPGGGWELSTVRSVQIPGSRMYGETLHVNRVEIQKGQHRQLVYYWFQQRGRVINNEYLVKGYLLWDALTRQRTDGALVRLTTPLLPGETWSKGDERLIEFATALSGRLEPYIPS